MNNENAIIENEDLVEFEITDLISLFYSIDDKSWFLLNYDEGIDLENEDDAILVEDIELDLYMLEVIDAWGYAFTITEFNECKQIVQLRVL